MRKRTLFTDRRRSDRASKNKASMNGETSVVEFPVALRFLLMFLPCHAREGVSSPRGLPGLCPAPQPLRTAPRRGARGRSRAGCGAQREGRLSLGKLAGKRNKNKMQTFVRTHDSRLRCFTGERVTVTAAAGDLLWRWLWRGSRRPGG